MYYISVCMIFIIYCRLEMKNLNVIFEKKENIHEMENLIGKEKITLCDEIQNNFLIICFDDIRAFGIAYYDYGIKPDYYYSITHKCLYLGVGMKFICMNTEQEKIVTNDNLKSVFYEILVCSNGEFICVICELNAYCYCNGKQIWEMGFSDIIVDYIIINNEQIIITCDDGRRYTLILQNGKLVK